MLRRLLQGGWSDSVKKTDLESRFNLGSAKLREVTPDYRSTYNPLMDL